jgi:hypothetical protein
MPARTEGGAHCLELPKVVRWLEARAARRERERAEAELVRLRRALEQAGDESGEVPWQEARRRRTLAEARLRELEVQERERELIPAHDVEKALLCVVSPIAAGLEALAAKAAAATRATSTDREAEAVLSRFVDELRTELADHGARFRP